MKNYIYCFSIYLFLISCNSNFINKRYVYLDVDKELELELILFEDSTFILKDINGCNQMSQKGEWKFLNDNNDLNFQKYILFDTTTVYNHTNIHNKVFYSYISNLNNKQYTIREEQYFPIIKNDTISFVKDDKVSFFRESTFIRSNKNLKKERIKILEKKLIDKIGVKMYIKTIGEGKSKKNARKNLSNCK